MKKLITFVVAVFVLVSVFPVFSLDAQERFEQIELPLSPGDFTLATSNLPSIPVHFELNPEKLITFQGKLFYEGMGLTQDFGYPQIPVVTKRIHLKNKNPVSISIESVDWEIRNIPDLDKYQPKTWGMEKIDYPEVNWEGMYPGKLGEYTIEEGSDGNWLSLLFAPISLDFERNEMIVFTSIDLKINYQIDFSLYSLAEENETEKAIILCPDLLRSAAESLAVIQREDGYEVEVVTVSSIDSRYSPQDKEPENMSGYEDMSKSERKFLEAYDYDLAKKIRSYFESEIDEIDYVTLMGDGELIPASFYSISGWSDYEFDRYIPTDLFYASPDLDTIPNFALGRLPVRNIDEANVVVEKIKNYREALREDDWFHKINLGGGDPFNGGFEGEIDCQALIDMGMLDGFEVNKYYKTRERFGSKDMIDALSDEAGFVYTISHGSGEALITEPGEVTTEDILNLPKRGKLPILLSPACINGMYDSTVVNHKLNEYEGGNGLSFSQACITSPGGPIAYFGGSRINYAGVNWMIEGGVVKTLPFDEMDRFMQEVMNSYHNWSGTLGEMTVQAYKKYVGIGSFSFFGTGDKTLLAFVFFGDPTIKLPATPGGSPHRIPDIEIVDAPMRDLSYGSIKIPVLSIIDENTLKIKSDIPWVNYEILNLETDVKVVSDWQKVEPGSERLFDISISPDDKSFWQTRVELPNLSEVWIYYLSAAEHDLSVESGRDFFITKPKKREHFYFYIINDGLKKEENITVDFFVDNKRIKTRNISELESGDYTSVYFKADDIDIGDHQIKIETSFDETDQYPEDNEFSRKLVVTEEDTCKTACLVSYFYPSYLVEDYLEIERYNDIASGFEGKPTEIAMIGSNSYWALVFGYPIPDLREVGADSVIIANINAINPFSSDSIDKLNAFNSEGGSIICMGSLYNSTAAPLFNQMYDWFGINPDIKTKLEETESDTFEPVSEDSVFFNGISKTPLEIKTKYSNKLIDTTWEEAIEDDKTVIHAKTTDNSGALISNKQNIFLSSGIDVETDDDLRFLYNLLSYNLRPRSDAMISLSGIECVPPLPKIDEEIEIIVTVENVGNTTLKNVAVKIDELGLESTIDELPKSESKEVSFNTKAPSETGIFIVSPSVNVENDIDDENNSTSLRIRINDKDENAGKNVISDINISDGSILPNELKLIKGKAVAGSFINISGRVGRADEKGNFAIPYTPTGLENGLSVKTKTPSGQTEDFKVWVAFEEKKSIGCQIDEKFFISSTNHVVKTDAPVFIIENEVGYVNLSEISEYLGLKLSENDDSIILAGKKVIYTVSKDGTNIVAKIGEWEETLTTSNAIKNSDGKIYLSLESLKKMSFNADLEDEPFSLLIDFPKISPQTETVGLNYVSSNIENRRMTVPSEADYGKPKLVSFGAMDGEIASLKEFKITSKKMYLWTHRGIQEWTLDGKYMETKGFPKTLSEDLDLSWATIFHPSSSYYSGYTMRFFITSDGGIMFITSDRLAIYDRDWNRLELIEFDDEMDINAAGCDNDGNLFVFDYYDNCHVFSSKGKKITDFEFINKDEERIRYISSHCVTPDGNVVAIESSSSYDLFSFGGSSWSIYLYDTSGNIISYKIFEENADSGLEEDEELPGEPSYIMADRDGTYWLIEADWSTTTVRHWNSRFEEIDSYILDTNLLRASGAQLADDGRFYISGSFSKEVDSATKTFAIMTINSELEEDYMVPYAKSDSKDRFYYPDYLTYDNEGNLVALDGVDIRKYDKMGTFIDSIHFKDESGEKAYATRFVFEDDQIYGTVSDWNNSCVFVANNDFEIQRKVPLSVDATEERDEYMLYPRGISADPDRNEIYIMDSSESNIVQVISDYSNTEKMPEKIEILRSFVPRGIGKSKVSNPRYLSRFEDKLFILDGKEKKIVAYNTKGEFLFEFGGEGETDGKMMSPQSMNIDKKGRIWISDAKLSKILIFDVNGTYITSLGSEGNLVPPGTISEYSSDPFTLLYPIEVCANDGQITILDYCHNRLIMLNSLQDTTNMSVIPENPKLSYYPTQMKASGSFNIVNSGPGTLEVEIKCEDENLEIEPSKFTGNFKTVNLKYNFGKKDNTEIPEFLFLSIESNIGTTVIKIPLNQNKIDFTIKEKSDVASGANGVIRLSNQITKSGDTNLVSSKDLVQLIPLSGTKSSNGQTLFYNICGRGLGFTIDKDVAELRLGEDVFNIHLNEKTQKKEDGSFMLPLDLISNFIGCEIVKQEDVLKVVSRN